MTLSIHSAIVGDYIKMLRSMQVWLDKAQAHADARKFDSAGYMSMKLAPDMLPLSRQVLIAGEIAKVGVERFAGLIAPKAQHEDASVQDLHQRVQGIIDHLAACTPAQIDGSAVTELVVPQRGKAPLVFDRQGFVHWSQANFFFHVTMTYALLRHAGVELGKADFLGLG